jgi:DNA mismatch endonuclease (patch repair protein)
MQANRSSGTRPERALRAALRALGLRGAWNSQAVLGTPDVAWPRRMVAVFVDGDFWHGRSGRLPRANRAFWRAKFERNRARDLRVTRLLRRRGWTVIRLWASDVVAAPMDAARRVALHPRMR